MCFAVGRFNLRVLPALTCCRPPPRIQVQVAELADKKRKRGAIHAKAAPNVEFQVLILLIFSHRARTAFPHM